MADIIVTDLTPRVQYTASGGATVFIYSFPIFANTDLNVYLTPVGVAPDDVTQILVYNVDYTVTNSVPPTVGGTITLSSGATAGDVITIVRNQPDNRLNNYLNGGLFEATTVNTDFDRTVFMAQQNKMYDRAVGVHYNLSAQPVAPLDTVLPVLGANEVWMKDGANTAIIAVDITGGAGLVNSVTGTANEITASPTQGNVVLSIPSTFVAPGTIRAVTSISSPSYLLTGSGSGTISILPQAAAGTYNFNLPTTAGTSGYLLTSAGGAGSPMTWTDPASITPTGAALTKTDDTNVTLTLGGTPATALVRAASLTLGWTGLLSLARGGTAANLTASNGGLVYSTASALAILSGTSTANQIPLSGANAAPSWSTATYPSTTTINQILYSSSANVIAGLATANRAVLTTGATGIPVLTALATDGQLIIGSTSGVPAAATLTAGANMTITNAGNSITLASAGGGISWQAVQTTNFSATSGDGYAVNTTGGAITATLPASPSAGDIISLVDYAGTFSSNNLTIDPNGQKIDGSTSSLVLMNSREAVQLVYIDATQGWLAYGGSHGSAPAPGTYSASYLVVGGGGGGGGGWGGGGGAGGFLTGTATLTTGTVYTVTVGAGGAAGSNAPTVGGNGSNSSALGATAIGGGGGGTESSPIGPGANGGSGGGGGGVASGTGGTGTGGQGNNGGSGLGGAVGTAAGAGGGGAGAVGANASAGTAGNGGNGSSSSITGSSITYAGGGGGGAQATFGTGGTGGGGAGSIAGSNGTAGTANTGGGGGGGGGTTGTDYAGGAGGSGVVIISVPTANYSATTTGSPTAIRRLSPSR